MGSDQAESLRRMLAPRVTRRIAVVGCEAGAGASMRRRLSAWSEPIRFKAYSPAGAS